ncbi:30S ribosomal protein S6 [Candidatus Blochmannia ocreatus (nom. nud.)]|uniref:Small ribosomal subunit protein bS6 n=1 Tax=Candidatus Blochmannia ocreatus (nom. nud.) TaxID=251538 RepID=A0ABY4SW01_9ENTR|nr:30S ribosomal protein S6 [Candidatus Blochmannia ocreatus]URJ25170.1 30S ribosomal protein S6 [Candidatus Blochmannia ocreatus]
MRHYEIVLLVHPDYNEQISNMIDHYKNIVTGKSGTVCRIENWGRRQLAYSIKKQHKAYYLLMNISVPKSEVIAELYSIFRFNDAILRSMIIRTKYAVTGSSFMMQKKEDITADHSIKI